MEDALQQKLIDIASTVTWKTQDKLRNVEDDIVKQSYAAFVAEWPLTDPVKRYLSLGSIPYYVNMHNKPRDEAEYIAEQRVKALWHLTWPRTETVGSLIRRPTMPTGNLIPYYVVIGDAPGVGDGAIFNRFDRVFVYGPSSHILRQALIHTGDYYECWFTNLLKLSTPDNRPSTLEECQSQRHLLVRELAVLIPDKIILLGAHAFDMFSNLHINYGGIGIDVLDYEPEVVRAYHPSYARRSNWTYKKYAEKLDKVF
jgi:uracil-DNA glycosylase family 4